MSANADDEDRVSALGLYNLSISYLDCAEQLYANLQNPKLLQREFRPAFPDPVYAVYGQALELVVKAYLRREGHTVARLKKLGHNIWRAFSELSAEAQSLLGFVNVDANTLAYLSETHRLRLNFYFYRGARRSVPLDQVVSTMAKIRLGRPQILARFGEPIRNW